MASGKQSEKFEKFVLANQHRFPVTVIATEGLYGNNTDKDVSNGDILRLLSVKNRCQAEFDHPVTKQRTKVDIPACDYKGGFLTVSQYGPDHVYCTAGDIAEDAAASVRVLEDLEIQGMLVKKGEGLKLMGLKTVGEIKYLHCVHYPSDVELLVPFEVKGRFSRRQDYTIYTLEELKDRMPIWVQIERNEGLQIRGYSKSIPGIPDDFYGTMCLTKTTFVQVEQWDDPGPSGFYDVEAKQDKNIPIGLSFTVTPADIMEAEHGPPEDLFTIACSALEGNPVLVRCCTGQKALDALDLAVDTMLVVHGVERRKGLVMKGATKQFLVPKNYKKTTMFKVGISISLYKVCYSSIDVFPRYQNTTILNIRCPKRMLNIICNILDIDYVVPLLS